MFCPVVGFNVNRVGKEAVVPWEPLWYDPSLVTVIRRYVTKSEPASDPKLSTQPSMAADAEIAESMAIDDSAHPRAPTPKM